MELEADSRGALLSISVSLNSREDIGIEGWLGVYSTLVFLSAVVYLFDWRNNLVAIY